MKFRADLHIHSSYSRATSSELTLENLHAWGQVKGISLIGTGDCLHPAWLAECRKKLADDGSGLLSLKHAFAAAAGKSVPAACAGPVRFMLTVEIANIYKKNGRVRKVHNVVCLPGIAAAETMATRLDRIGNLKSDGRPIFGLDSRDLLEIALETNPQCLLIPAHIWTPWFSALGSKSGFDSIEECYGDLTKHIHAVETGLSSDPAMNWRLSSLDPFALVSCSDAHSPAKLGRECTLFDTDFSYPALFRALADPADAGLAGTVEFFPEEGKYHADGHRACGVRLTPRETRDCKGVCPSCGRPVTVGVLSRVEELADRAEGTRGPRAKPFRNLVPLVEIIGEALDAGPATKAVGECYATVTEKIGSEFTVLLDAPIPDIAAVAGDCVAEGVRRMRSGEVSIAAGFDGEFGTIKLFTDRERKALAGQENLFGPAAAARKKKIRSDSAGGATPRKKKERREAAAGPDAAASAADVYSGVNEAQRKAIDDECPRLLIEAGPGTGKTRTLTRRIARIARSLPPPARCLALTFTVKAAEEMRRRLNDFGNDVARRVYTGTIHAFCLDLLRAHTAAAGLPPSFQIASPEEIDGLARIAWPEAGVAERRAMLQETALLKSRVTDAPLPDFADAFDALLRSRRLVDFDTILHAAYRLLKNNVEVLSACRLDYPRIFVDEYQDINEIQHAIIVLLAGNHGAITAIGDPFQSIYGFRGSSHRFFDSFAVNFPGAAVRTLTENYRTAPTILRAFEQVIARSTPKPNRSLEPRVSVAGKLMVHTAANSAAEAEYVAGTIERLVGGTGMISSGSLRTDFHGGREFAFADIAVLYRTNSLRRSVEEALSKIGIPLLISGEQPFHARPSIARLLALFKLCAGERLPPESLCTLLGQPRDFAPLFDLMSGRADAFSLNEFAAFIVSAPLPRETTRRCGSFIETIRNAGELLKSAQLEQALLACATPEQLQRDLEKGRNGQALSWQRLLRIARTAASYREFMDTVLLHREEDGIAGRAEAVSLMTLHAAKGLEWAVVFIIGCEDGRLPLTRDGGSVDAGEERRLFYVGMSRARELLYLTNARERTVFGETAPCRPSPFLADIGEGLSVCERGAPEREKPDAEQLCLF